MAVMMKQQEQAQQDQAQQQQHKQHKQQSPQHVSMFVEEEESSCHMFLEMEVEESEQLVSKPMIISNRTPQPPSPAAASATATTRPSIIEPQSSNANKTVCFGDVHVRHYSQVLGDHPYCVSGLPLSLGWDYYENEGPAISVDEFERQQQKCGQRRRRSSEMRLSLEARRAILKDVSDEDIRKAQRRFYKYRRCHHGRASRIHKFFQTPSNMQTTAILTCR